jgi:hypothetical protein
MKDRTRFTLMKAFGAVLIAGIALFMGYVFVFELGENTSPDTLFWLLAPAVLIIAILVLFLKRMGQGIRKGLPLEDEMSKRIKERAGYLAFMITLWFLIGMMWYEMMSEELGLPLPLARHMPIIVLLFMACVFGLLWFMISRRGDTR